MSDTTTENVTPVDMERLEALLTDINKAVTAQAEQTAEIETTDAEVIAKGADAIVTATKEANEALVKSVADLNAKLDAMSERMNALVEAVTEKVEKGLEAVASQPVLSKAVKAEAEIAPADPAPVAAPALTRDDVLNKALTELKSAQGERKMALLKGIAMLDSNFAPAEVAAELNLA